MTPLAWFMVGYTLVVIAGYTFLWKYMSSNTKEDEDNNDE